MYSKISSWNQFVKSNKEARTSKMSHHIENGHYLKDQVEKMSAFYPLLNEPLNVKVIENTNRELFRVPGVLVRPRINTTWYQDLLILSMVSIPFDTRICMLARGGPYDISGNQLYQLYDISGNYESYRERNRWSNRSTRVVHSSWPFMKLIHGRPFFAK